MPNQEKQTKKPNHALNGRQFHSFFLNFYLPHYLLGTVWSWSGEGETQFLMPFLESEVSEQTLYATFLTGLGTHQKTDLCLT